MLADHTPLTVHRFDDHWISATRGDMSYELDRQSGNLTYASSTMKNGAATIVIGSGRQSAGVEHPINSVREIRASLRACWISPEMSVPPQVTVRLELQRLSKLNLRPTKRPA